jgi:crotonobetainyl-CoA:carnitine CoA-transferase CaiB-like acyl-CoA transferase
MTDQQRPLHGVRVLDLTRLLPGAYATQLLDFLGAEVTKVEDPQAGDYIRELGAQFEGQGSLHHLVNRNKRSIALSLKDARSRPVVELLLDRSDVVIESFRPGTAARLGLDYERVSATRPGLVYASLTGFGQRGPYRDMSGHELNYLAVSGWIDRLTDGHIDHMTGGIPLADLVGGMHAAMGVLALLVKREHTGVGGYYDAAITDVLSLMPDHKVADAMMRALTEESPATAVSVTPGVVFDETSACFEVYRAADCFVAVCALEAKFWRICCELLRLPDLIPAQYDPTRQEEIRGRLRERFASMRADDVEALFIGSDACVTVVATFTRMIASSNAAERNFLVNGGDLAVPGLASPFVFDGVRARGGGPAPRHGEQSAEILADLGLTDTEIGALIDEGVVGTTADQDVKFR